jgi:hypothetical protein
VLEGLGVSSREHAARILLRVCLCERNVPLPKRRLIVYPAEEARGACPLDEAHGDLLAPRISAARWRETETATVAPELAGSITFLGARGGSRSRSSRTLLSSGSRRSNATRFTAESLNGERLTVLYFLDKPQEPRFNESTSTTRAASRISIQRLDCLAVQPPTTKITARTSSTRYHLSRAGHLPETAVIQMHSWALSY